MQALSWTRAAWQAISAEEVKACWDRTSISPVRLCSDADARKSAWRTQIFTEFEDALKEGNEQLGVNARRGAKVRCE
jgi:hypothetical protein